MLVHRQVMLLAWQPKLGARFIMLLMHVFCEVSVTAMQVLLYGHRRRTYTASRQAVDGTEVLSEANPCEKHNGKKGVLHCECDGCDIGLM